MNAIFSEILVRYGELALKSPPVRKFMEKKLVSNIERTLRNNNIHRSKFKVINYRKWGRIIVELYSWDKNPVGDYKDNELEERVVSLLENYVCGITSTSPSKRISSNLEEILHEAELFVKDRIKPSASFAVKVKRTGKHPYASHELGGKVGERILDMYGKEKNLSVDLTNPEYALYIEVKDQFAFMFDSRENGIGGFPQGTQGKLATILRGSIEDAIAGFLLCKRGSISLPIIFERKQQEEYTRNSEALQVQLKKYRAFQPLQKHTHFKVDFDEILEKIGYDRLQCSTCDKICIGVTERIVKEQYKHGITLGNSTDAILVRNPEKNILEEFIPIYYPLIALNPSELAHPFTDEMKNSFCLESCPGYENQRKKERKPPPKEELLAIVASANYTMVKTDST